MTAAQKREAQTKFLESCTETTQTLDEIIEHLELPPQTLAGWLNDRGFRKRLHALTTKLRRQRKLQLEVGATRAAAMLTRLADQTASEPTPLVRAACVDLIRLARDSQARKTANDVDPDVHRPLDPRYRLFHPTLGTEEAAVLMREFDNPDSR